MPKFLAASLLMLSFAALAAGAALHGVQVLPNTGSVLASIYSFDLDSALEQARRMQQQYPDQPLGYLLEGEALWYRIWCQSMDYKWGMIDARHRPKLESDQQYLDLARQAASLAASQIKQHDSSEMQFYAGMADALAARLYGLRGDNRATARFGVRAREHFLAAKKLDPELADTYFGLGLYNYYVDTLSGIAKILRFFMGIPGGNKLEGLRQLEEVVGANSITSNVARFYLALNLHRYDREYAQALSVITPLVQQYPSNPLFLLIAGDLEAKLGHKEPALSDYRRAASLPVEDAECRGRIQAVAQAAAAAVQANLQSKTDRDFGGEAQSYRGAPRSSAESGVSAARSTFSDVGT